MPSIRNLSIFLLVFLQATSICLLPISSLTAQFLLTIEHTLHYFDVFRIKFIQSFFGIFKSRVFARFRASWFRCSTYQTPFSEYIQEALVEAMKFDIEESNFCDTLLEKIDNDVKSKNNSPSSAALASDLMNSDLDLLKKLQTRIP